MGRVVSVVGGLATVENSGGCVAWWDNVRKMPSSFSSPSGHTITNSANWLDRRYALRGKVERTTGLGSAVMSVRVDLSSNPNPGTQLVFLTDVDAKNVQSSLIRCYLVDPSGNDIAQMFPLPMQLLRGKTQGYMNNLAFLFDKAYAARYVRIEVTTTISGAYLEFSRWWAGPCLYRDAGVDKGYTVQTADYSQVNRLPNGVVDVDRNELHRVVKCSVSRVTKVEAFGAELDADATPTSIHDLGAVNAQTREIVVVPSCDNNATIQSSAVIGYASAPPALRHGKGENWTFDVTVTEGR